VAKFTVEQAYTRYVTRTATYLGAQDYEPLAHDFNVELGFIYHSNAIVAEDDEAKSHDDPRRTLGRPGSRAPHLWVEHDGERLSTLDLFGRSYVLLAGPLGAAWCAAAREAAKRFESLKIEAYCVGGPDLADSEGRFCSAYGIARDGACLVRPDGFVAWRVKEDAADRLGLLTQTLTALLLRPL
jgi:putative polyketide hydroxylase